MFFYGRLKRFNHNCVLAHDEMPQEAIACGGAEKIVPLNEIAQTINAFTRLSK